MPTVAIIAEYNPFHNGHKYQIDKIREEFGKDAEIVVIMSGNYTQRGEVALYDKYLRARACVDCGVNLVLELPFPYSSSSAEIFARSAVHILDKIGVIDYLSFGSESGNTDSLTRTALVMLSDEFNTLLASMLKDPRYCSDGYPKMCEAVLSEILGTNGYTSPTPNNILALEYIKALITYNSHIKSHTIKRCGAGYNDDSLAKGAFQSATYLRLLLAEDAESAKKYIPEKPFNLYSHDAPVHYGEKLSTALIGKLRTMSPDVECISVQDVDQGLFYRIRSAAFTTDNLSELIRSCETKKYTTARIRRALLNLYFDVSPSDVSSLPEYTQILALDNTGRAIIKRIKAESDFPIITKPSSTDSLSDTALKQKKLSDVADSIYHLSSSVFTDGNTSLRSTPYVKLDE